MKQSHLMSLLETALSTAIGFVVALITQVVVFPLFGFQPRIEQNLLITLIFTVVSIVRQFFVRRLFEAFHIRRPLSPFINAVIAERFRQIDAEGWTIEHDDEHATGELELAGAAYALGERVIRCERSQDGEIVEVSGRLIWPWDVDWWKPRDYRRNLVRSVALIIAAGEKFDRARKPGRGR